MKTIQTALFDMLMWLATCKTYMRIMFVGSLVWNIMILPVHIVFSVASRHPKTYFQNLWWSVKTTWEWFVR